MKTGFGILFLLLGAALAAQATGTAAWEMNSYQDFVKGRFSGVSLSRDGRLMLAPALETLFAPDQPAIWSVAQAPDGSLYLGTGHRGRLYRVDRSGAGSLLWTAEEPEIFAVAVDPKGNVFAATSPNGKVYRLEGGKAAEYFAPRAKYIWSLAFAKDGSLYVGTGDEGRIYRVTAPGKGEVWYETGQAHITCLALDTQGRLLAGSEPNGILYRVSAKDKAFVLYDAGLPEIRSVVPASDGAVYAAAMGGSVARRAAGAALPQAATGGGATVTSTSTSITVTEEAAQGGVEIKPKAEAPKPAAPASPQVTTQFSPVVDLTGVEKSAVYRIGPDNLVETLWSSKEENVYDILPLAGQLILSTDGQGRVYRLSPDRKITLLAQTNESEATRLAQTPGGLVAATGNMGKLFRLGEAPGPAGSYESPVHDAGTVARWGRLSWRGDVAGGGKTVFRTRSGNSSRPDKTWSDWSEPLAGTSGGPVTSPNARYIQWKAELSGGAGAGPVLDSVTVSYLPQNTPPVVRSITVISQAVAAGTAKPAAQAPAAAYSVTVTDTGEAGAASSAGTPTQALARTGARQIQITWQAEDTDGDRLIYALYFRGEDEQEWKLLKDNLQENTWTVDGDVFADGRYFFRVKASDLPGNPPAAAREAESTSSPVLVDNTPPVIRLGPPQRSGARVSVGFEAMDAASDLRRAEYSVDAGPWTPLEAADGVIDSQRESFTVVLDNLPPGEHLLVTRVYDSANNAGLAKLVLR